MAGVDPQKKPRLDETTSAMAAATSWVPMPAGCGWTVQNIPFGVAKTSPDSAPVCVTAIGEKVVSLAAVAEAGLFDGAEYAPTFAQPALNGFMAAGRAAWRDARAKLQALFTGADARLKDSAELQAKCMFDTGAVVMQLPCTIGDYTDFYSSREHATNVGIMFRGKDNALQPNWLHLPVGYHGRASSVVLSGTPVHRPWGQLQADAADPSKGSVLGTCRLMDFELEMATFVGPGNAMGRPIAMSEAEEHIFGLCLMNDWSARDIQKWEYVPLGPFTAKNLATSVAPWIITLDALEPFRSSTSAGTQDDPKPLPYLVDPQYSSYDVKLEVSLRPAGSSEEYVISRSNFKNMYWNIKQQLVHHTITGCNMRPGDCLGSGTISGSTPDSFGSMLELCWKGTKPQQLAEGVERKFLQDGDTVTIRGYCEADGMRLDFGEVSGQVLPAIDMPSA